MQIIIKLYCIHIYSTKSVPEYRLERLRLPRNSVVRLTDRRYITEIPVADLESGILGVLDIVRAPPPAPPSSQNKITNSSCVLAFLFSLLACIMQWSGYEQQSLKKRKSGEGTRGSPRPHCKSRAAPLSGTRGRRPPAQNENKVLKWVGKPFP